MPDVLDHYRPGGDDAVPGVYRVVGTGEEVTLLRVADADGRRVHTGEIRHVPVDDLDARFDPAENPDVWFSPVSALQNALQGLYWQVRTFL